MTLFYHRHTDSAPLDLTGVKRQHGSSGVGGFYCGYGPMVVYGYETYAVRRNTGLTNKRAHNVAFRQFLTLAGVKIQAQHGPAPRIPV